MDSQNLRVLTDEVLDVIPQDHTVLTGDLNGAVAECNVNDIMDITCKQVDSRPLSLADICDGYNHMVCQGTLPAYADEIYHDIVSMEVFLSNVDKKAFVGHKNLLCVSDWENAFVTLTSSTLAESENPLYETTLSVSTSMPIKAHFQWAVNSSDPFMSSPTLKMMRFLNDGVHEENMLPYVATVVHYIEKINPPLGKEMREKYMNGQSVHFLNSNMTDIMHGYGLKLMKLQFCLIMFLKRHTIWEEVFFPVSVYSDSVHKTFDLYSSLKGMMGQKCRNNGTSLIDLNKEKDSSVYASHDMKDEVMNSLFHFDCMLRKCELLENCLIQSTSCKPSQQVLKLSSIIFPQQPHEMSYTQGFEHVLNILTSYEGCFLDKNELRSFMKSSGSARTEFNICNMCKETEEMVEKGKIVKDRGMNKVSKVFKKCRAKVKKNRLTMRYHAHSSRFKIKCVSEIEKMLYPYVRQLEPYLYES